MTWLAIHLELMATLPVRTHQWQPPADEPDPEAMKAQRELRDQRKERIREAAAKGLSQRAIAKEVKLSRPTVVRYLKRIAREKRRRGR